MLYLWTETFIFITSVRKDFLKPFSLPNNKTVKQSFHPTQRTQRTQHKHKSTQQTYSWRNGCHHKRGVAQPCVNGDRLSKGRMAKFGPAQTRNPSTDRYKIWNGRLSPRDDSLYKISCKSVHWGLLGKWVKYNENFSALNIPVSYTHLTLPTKRIV